MKPALIVESFVSATEVSGGVVVSVRMQADFLRRHSELVVIAPRRAFLPLGRYAAMETAQARSRRFVSAEDNTRIYRPVCLHTPLLWRILEPLQIAFWVLVICVFFERGVTLLHAHRCFPAGFVASLVAPFLRLPVVLTVYGSDINFGLDANAVGRWVSSASRFALRHSDYVIAVSRALAERIHSAGVPMERIDVVSSGVDTSQVRQMAKEEARAKVGLPLEARVVLYVANLLPVKDPLTMIRAFAVLRKSRDTAFLVVLGAGELEAAVREESGKLGLSDSVLFAGRRPREEIPYWIGAADVVSLSSIEEGCPVIVQEAFAAGRPFVGTRVGGVPEIVPDHVGILVEPREPEALAAALDSALSKSWDVRKLRAHGLTFSRDVVGSRVLEAYRLATGDRTAGAGTPV
ncbi:MAG: glycosyltransferase [Candidatus Eisenbacteria bacterium]